jgi:hypothetical protein
MNVLSQLSASARGACRADRRRRLQRLVLVAALCSAWPSIAWSQDGCGCPPDQGFKPAGTGSLAYANRGNRCEGFVMISVAVPALRVVSLTESVDRARPSDSAPLRLEWPLPAGGTSAIQIHAQALRSRGYRMDAQCSSSTGSFLWPTDVLSTARLSPADLGVVVSATRRGGRGVDQVLLPVRIGRAATAGNDYRLQIVASIELAEVFFRTVTVDANGRPQNTIQESTALGQKYYPPNLPIDIRIAKPAGDGLIAVHIGARDRSGLTSVLEVLIYHPRTANAGH